MNQLMWLHAVCKVSFLFTFGKSDVGTNVTCSFGVLRYRRKD